VQDKELALAKMLIESLLAPFEPGKYKDNYRENLMAMIKAKVEGKEIVEPAAPAHKAPVIDILEALKMSLAEAKKPPQSVREASTGASAEMETAKPKKSRKSSGAD
jgi:DNA end-binding protein Ku